MLGSDPVSLASSSPNPAVAIVEDGEVRALAAGEALISAEGKGYRGLARVTVRDRAQHEPDEDGDDRPKEDGEAEEDGEIE